MSEPGNDVSLSEVEGIIHPDLSAGADVSRATGLLANSGLSFMGLIPLGVGFRLESGTIEKMGYTLGTLPRTIRRYKTGNDVAKNRPDRYLIDFHGMSASEAMDAFPPLYQHLRAHVKPFRDNQKRKSNRELWWIHGEARPALRAAIRDLSRFIATVETSKHRYFVFLDSDILPDQKLRIVAHEDAYVLGVLSSRGHLSWTLATGGSLEDRPVYNGTLCFDPFPFPAATDEQKAEIRDLGERLDAHRKRVQEQHDDITLTGLYNVLEQVRAGEPLTDKERDIYDRGLVGILKEIHDQLDAAAARAYGWPEGLSDEAILERLVALNHERAAEEERGIIRYLRPDFQAPDAQQAELTLDTETKPSSPALGTVPTKLDWPRTLPERMRAVQQLIASETSTPDPAGIAKRFKRARTKDVEDIMEALEVLGLVR